MASLRESWAHFLEDSSMVRQYLWEYRRWIGIGLLALVVVDLMEVIPPILMKSAVDVATEDKPRSLLLGLAAGYFAVSVVQAICRYGWRMYLVRSSIFAGRDIRNTLSQHLFGLSSSFFDRTRIGETMSLATSDVEAVRQEIGMGILILADSLFYFMTVPVAMFLLSPRLTFLTLIPLLGVPFIVFRNEKKFHPRYEKVQEELAGISSFVQEALSAVRVIKAFAREDVVLSRFRRQGEAFITTSMRLARVQTAFGPILEFWMSMGMVTLIFVGGYDLVHESSGALGAVTLGTFVAFQRYVQKMVWPMAAIGMAINTYQRSVTSSGRIKAVLREASDVADVAQPLVPAGLELGKKTRGAIEFRGLTFKYPGTEREILKNISLKIEPGQRVAFVGTIGSGKSALLALLPRLYPVGRGMLLIDGVDINDWPLAELRRQVGYVSQDVFLFSESVTENVAFGLRNWAAQESEVRKIEEAAHLAAVHEDVLGLEDSYKTRLGERGVNLSGGQKQRLTIARALIKQPSILVLDDALSSVDTRTEEKILAGLRGRGERNTEIIAAHRISTIQDADWIVVLEHGSVRQQGSHADLLADRRGSYRRFYEEQQRKEDLESYAQNLGGDQ